MAIDNFLIEDNNTREGRLRILNMIIQSSPDWVGKKNIRICWDYYNNKQDPEKFDYLRKSGKYEYPAKIRRIPKQRTYIDNLVSQQSQRPFAFSVYSVDDESIEKKYNMIVKNMLKMAEERAAQAYYQLTAQLGMLEQQRQKMISMLQQEPQTPEQQQAMEQMRSKLPQINSQLEYMKRGILQQQSITKEDMDKLERFYKYSYRDTTEIIAQKCIRFLRQDLNIAYKEVQGVKHRTVTGLEYYLVDYRIGDKLPIFENLNEAKVYAPSSDQSTWIQDGPWVRIEEGMNYDQIISEYGVYLSSNDIQALKSQIFTESGVASGNFIATPRGAVLRDTVKGVYSGGGSASGTYTVNKVWWKVPRIIKAKRVPSPFEPGQELTHFISDKKTIINESDFTYNISTREWISKDNPDVTYKASEVETINKQKGEYIKQRTVYDRYKGFRINNIVEHAFKDPIQPRPITDLSHVLLPVVGRMHNSTTDAPYSLIWNTIDLQETYDIIHYHRELMLALSGVAGVVMDLSQKPEDMEEEEWFYHMKLGRFLIETVTKTGRKNFTFNQFPRVDMSLSASIQYLDQMLRSVDETMGMVMGVTRQRLGQTVNTDQVGTFEMSRNLSMLTTEIIFREHDETIRQALTMALNMSFRYCWNNGALLQLVDDGVEYLEIPPNELNKIEFVAKIENNTQEAFNLDELRKVGMNLSMKGQISFKEFVNIYTSVSVRELEKKLEYLATEATKMMQLAESNKAEAMGELEQRKQNFQLQLEQIRAENEQKLKALTEQISAAKDSAKLQFEKELAVLEQQRWQAEQELATQTLMVENETANRKIDADIEKTNIDAQVKILLKQMDNVIRGLEISNQKRQEEKKNEIEEKKIEKSVTVK